jgi:hypothetical protein
VRRVWVCEYSLVEIVGLNSAERMDICLLWVLGVGRWRPLRRADHSSRGVLASVVCLSEIAKPRMGRLWPGTGSRGHKEKVYIVSWWQILPVQCTRIVSTQSLFDPLESMSNIMNGIYIWMLRTPVLASPSNSLISYDFPSLYSLVGTSMLDSLLLLSACRTNISF